VLEAAFWLAVTRLAVVFVCFPRIARHIGSLHAPADLQTDSSQDRTVVREISWAIDRSARLLQVRLCLPAAGAGRVDAASAGDLEPRPLRRVARPRNGQR
jgi:hypothetical protein